MGIAEARADFARRIEAAHFGGETTVITKNGQPRAALVSYEWFTAAIEAMKGRR